MAAIAVGADCTFIPECPPPFQKDIDITWEKEMCEIIKTVIIFTILNIIYLL